jgi:hypothetical protein
MISDENLSVDFTFNLPFCLHLPDGEYNVKLSEGGSVILRLEKKVPESYDERTGYRGLMEQDLKNVHKVHILNQEFPFEGTRYKVISAAEVRNVKEFCEVVSFEDNEGNKWFPDVKHTESNPIFTGLKILLNAEIVKDRFGRLRYTRVSVVSDTLKSSRARIISAVNKLIDSYRIISNEYWLYRIREEDILFVSSETQFDYEGFSKAKPDISNERVEHLKSLLSIKEPVSTFSLVLLDMRTALFEEKFALAIVYAITALESLVKQYIEKMAYQKNLTKLTSKQLQNMNLFNLVTVVLRLTLGKDKLPDNLVEDFIDTNRLRNQIIHKAVMDVSKDDAEKALSVVQQLITILSPLI